MIKIVKSSIIIFLIGCIIFGIGNAFYTGFAFNSFKDLVINFGFYQLYAFVLGFSNMYFFGYLEAIHWKQSSKVKRITIGVFGFIIITLSGLFLLRMCIALLYRSKSFDEFIANETFKDYHFGLFITLIIVVIFHTVYFYNQYQQNRVKKQKVIAGTASARFHALKNQLDPHFLFNSLNVLTSLIEEQPKKAQEFTIALSKVYRYVLEQKDKHWVTIDQELAFARIYMSLLKMRFEDSIVFDIPEQAKNPEAKVVPLSLQLLLENAVKHNMVTNTKPLHIKIYETTNALVVENNLQPKQNLKKSSGVGLNNIRQRYKLLTNKTVFINQEAQRFIVSIPKLTKQILLMRTLPSKHSSQDYIRARKHVEQLKEFYYGIIAYCFVIPFLIFINYKTFWHFQWFWFPAIGWGIGILFQAYKVFVNDGILGRDWEQKKIAQFMKEEEQKRWN